MTSMLTSARAPPGPKPARPFRGWGPHHALGPASSPRLVSSLLVLHPVPFFVGRGPIIRLARTRVRHGQLRRICMMAAGKLKCSLMGKYQGAVMVIRPRT